MVCCLCHHDCAEVVVVPDNLVLSEPYFPLTPDETPTPQWVRLLFCPSNPWLASSAAYRYKFDISSKLLSRTAHHEHIDSEYAARTFKHLREFAIELKKMGVRVVVVFADDKSTAKVGEVGDPVAATERNKRVLTTSLIQALASMHDFAHFKVLLHIASLCLTMSYLLCFTLGESYSDAFAQVG